MGQPRFSWSAKPNRADEYYLSFRPRPDGGSKQHRPIRRSNRLQRAAAHGRASARRFPRLHCTGRSVRPGNLHQYSPVLPPGGGPRVPAQAKRNHRRRIGVCAAGCQSAPEHHRQRRHGLGKDDADQRAFERLRRSRTHRRYRRHARVAGTKAACGPDGGPTR